MKTLSLGLMITAVGVGAAAAALGTIGTRVESIGKKVEDFNKRRGVALQNMEREWAFGGTAVRKYAAEVERLDKKIASLTGRKAALHSLGEQHAKNRADLTGRTAEIGAIWGMRRMLDAPVSAYVRQDDALNALQVAMMRKDGTVDGSYEALKRQTNVLAYRGETLLREAIQDAAKLNLLRYSRAPIIDMIGELVGVARPLAAPAGTTLQFVFAPSTQVRTIPAGTTAQAGTVAFALAADIAVPANATSVAGKALCSESGIVGNGFVAGQVNAMAQALPGFASMAVANVETTAGGAEDARPTRLAA